MAKKRASKIPKRYVYFLIVFLILLILYSYRYRMLDYYYSYVYGRQENLHPSQTYIPSKYDVIGLDISRYQMRFNWDKAQLLNQYRDTIEVQFIIAKATEGTRILDPMFFYNKQQAAEHEDIIFGAYHFFLPNLDVEAQANHFVNAIQLEDGNLVPVIDIEQRRGQSNEKIRERLKMFCNLLENKYGKKPIIYSNKDFFLKVLGDTFKDYPLWVAHYQVDDLQMPEDWDWEIWQLTDRGSCFGTKHHVDVNALKGSKRDLKKLTISR